MYLVLFYSWDPETDVTHRFLMVILGDRTVYSRNESLNYKQKTKPN